KGNNLHYRLPIEKFYHHSPALGMFFGGRFLYAAAASAGEEGGKRPGIWVATHVFWWAVPILPRLGPALQEAGLAKGLGAAQFLPQAHQQGVVFLIKPHVRRQMVHEESAQVLVSAGFRGQLVPAQDAESIGVYHKGGFLQGIEQNAVGGFRADAFDRKEPEPQLFQ